MFADCADFSDAVNDTFLQTLQCLVNDTLDSEKYKWGCLQRLKTLTLILPWCCSGSVSIVADYTGLYEQGIMKLFLFFKASTLTLRPTQLPVGTGICKVAGAWS